MGLALGPHLPPLDVRNVSISIMTLYFQRHMSPVSIAVPAQDPVPIISR